MTTSDDRYLEKHERILQLKEEVGVNFWALGAELTSMQRECADCGHVPLGSAFHGNQSKSTCPQCSGTQLGLYKIQHKRFEDYLAIAKIHRQTAYRKISVFETFEPLIELVSQMAPSNLWSNAGPTGIELREDWARRYLSRIGWTILESVQKRIAQESDPKQIMRIIEEAGATSRQRASQADNNIPTKSYYFLSKTTSKRSKSASNQKRSTARKNGSTRSPAMRSAFQNRF